LKKVIITEGDITKLKVDEIVNAANNSLLGGGGVDGAIHRAAGPKLLAECRTLNGCNTGEAKYTDGYNLNAKYIIHTVGPVWRGGGFNEDDLLKNCYTNSLRIALELNVKSIAFPSISTGAYGFPFERATEIAFQTVKNFLSTNNQIESVNFVAFGETTFKIMWKMGEANQII